MTTQSKSARSQAKGRTSSRDAGLPRRVLKFGGTSVTGASRLDVIERVVRDRLDKSAPIVVVSALSGMTETLRRASELAVRGEAGELLREIEQRHRDAVQDMTGGDAETSGAVDGLLADARRLLHGIELLGECSPRTLD